MGTIPRRAQRRVPELLVSVRNQQELAEAIRGGADWIDLKEPSRGALGAIPYADAKRMLSCRPIPVPVSAAGGELANWASTDSFRLLELEEVSVIKLGLSGASSLVDWPNEWRYVQREVHRAGKELAAVVYADWSRCQAPEPREVLGLAKTCKVPFVLFDSFHKDASSLLDLLPPGVLHELLEHAHTWECKIALAGQLGAHSLPRLIDYQFDVLAVRGAVCLRDRLSEVRQHRVQDLKAAIQAIFAADSEQEKCHNDKATGGPASSKLPV